LKSTITIEGKGIRNRILLIASGIFIIAFLLIKNIPISNILGFASLTLIKLSGLTTSILLLIYDLDKKNSFVSKICSAGGQTSCDSVLSSKASKIGGLSWSEIGLFYFFSTTLILILPYFSFQQKTSWVAIANTFASPYIFYSIFYQWKVIRKWCTLCLSIQFALLLELIWSSIYFWNQKTDINLTIYPILSILTTILLPISVWFSLKPFFTKAIEYDQYKSAYKRLQNNKEIFNSLLRQQTVIMGGWEKIGINIGSSENKIAIVKVCNPFCGPCAKAHLLLDALMRERNDISVKIIFNVKNNVQDRGFSIVNKDYDLFAKFHPLERDLNLQNHKIENMSHWTQEAEIVGTPTFFVNGHRLPENYGIEELKSIL